MATGAERQAKWMARHKAEVARLRQIAAEVARLVRNEIHSDQDKPIIQRAATRFPIAGRR
jgi:hypothetical protein